MHRILFTMKHGGVQGIYGWLHRRRLKGRGVMGIFLHLSIQHIHGCYFLGAYDGVTTCLEFGFHFD